MDDHTISFSPAASHCGSRRICIAMELSKKNWLAAMLRPLSDRISLYTLPAGDGSGLLKLIAGVRPPAAGEA